MPVALLDTDTYSELSKGRDTMLMSRAAAYAQREARYALSVLTVAEVVRGFQRVQREDRLQEFLERLRRVEVLTLNQETAVLGGRIDGDLARTGQTIGVIDPLIAAIAITHGRVLVTGNTAHYQRIQSLGYPLQLDDWRQPV